MGHLAWRASRPLKAADGFRFTTCLLVELSFSPLGKQRMPLADLQGKCLSANEVTFLECILVKRTP